MPFTNCFHPTKRPLHTRSGNKFRGCNRREGAAVVEFAIVGPLMIMLTMGMMEVGRAVMVKQLMVNASREGARMAILPSADSAQVIAHVGSQLTAASVDGFAITLTPPSLADAPPGTPITVSISASASDVSWIPNPAFTLNQTISASTTMRRESL